MDNVLDGLNRVYFAEHEDTIRAGIEARRTREHDDFETAMQFERDRRAVLDVTRECPQGRQCV